MSLTRPDNRTAAARWIVAIICLTSCAAGLYAALLTFSRPAAVSQPQIDGFIWPQQIQLTAFELIDHQRRPFTPASFAGQWNFLFFGYTHCPDICPLTLSILRQTGQKIAALSPPVAQTTRITFVSVDGERDTPERLAAYLRFFDPAFRGATGSRQQVDALTTQLGIPYEIETHAAGQTDYLVAHSGAVLLITPAGRLAAIFRAPHDADSIAARYAAMRAFMQARQSAQS